MQLADYADRYAGIRFTRSDDGVLELQMHTRGGAALWGTSTKSLHAELGHAFHDLARDVETKVVILTGTGDTFIAGRDREENAPEATRAEMWDRISEEGVALLDNLRSIPVPVIAAVNGPATIHAELAVLADIVLAADHAEFADLAHPGMSVLGDGVHTVWPMLLGPNRGRHFLLTGQVLSAHQALDLGVVAEVLPATALMPRAREIAAMLAQRPRRQLRYTRAVLTRHIRARLREELDFGLAVEGVAML